MDDFFIHENLKKFIFPNAPHSWKATNTFFIHENVCSIVQDVQDVTDSDENFEAKKEKKILKKENETEEKNVEKEEKNFEKEVIKKNNSLEIPLFHMFEDLQQNCVTKISQEDFCKRIKKWDVSSLLYFSSICFKEYQKCESIIKHNQFMKKSRLFSKLILGIFHVNNMFVCTLKEFKKCKDFSFQDMEIIKSLLKPFDILDKDVFELGQPNRKNLQDELFFVLANIETKEMYGIVWGVPWKISKESEFVKIEQKDGLSEIQNCLYIKALNVAEHKKIPDTQKIKSLLYLLVLSETQCNQYESIIWKPCKIGEYPSIKEMEYWKTNFDARPTFAIEEGIQKLPKQEISCDIFSQELEYTSSFREVQNNLKSLEKCKKYKFIKDEFVGLWKEIKNKTITIVIKKKLCFSNIFLCHQTFPDPMQFMKYFVHCQEHYEEEESLTSIEKIILNDSI